MKKHSALWPSLRRRATLVLGCALAAATCLPAAAQTTARSYAVLSLSADKIFVVVPQMSTGSQLDRNIRDVFPTSDDSLEVVALQAAAEAIKQKEPEAAIDLFVTRDPKIYAELGNEDGTVNLSTLMPKLKAVVGNTKATHLLLITRHRDTAAFKLSAGYLGKGRLYGVGFYVDERAGLSDTEEKDVSRGFVGPYAALKVQLIELATLRTVRSDNSLASEIRLPPASAASAWEGLSTAEKGSALQSMVKQAVGEAIPRVLKTP